MTDPTAPPDGAPWLPGGFLAMPDGSVAPPAQEAHGSELASAPGFPFLAQPPPLPPVGTGAYTVDLERAPAAVRELEDAKTKLEELHRSAFSLGRLDTTAADTVSRDAATALGAAAIGGPGSLVQALASGIDQLDALIGKVRDELANYGRAEDDASASLSSIERT